MTNVIGYNPHFASSTAIEPGSVLATDAKGNERYVILDKPETTQNIVGGRTFYTYRVRLEGTTVEGRMTFAASDYVYLRTEYDTEGNQL